MAVAGSIGHAINVGQGFGMAEIASFPYRKVQGNGGVSAPIGGDVKSSAEDEIRVRLTPVRAPWNQLPVYVVHFWGNWRINQRAFQLEVSKKRQWLAMAVNQWLDQPQASVDFSGGQANVVKHFLPQFYIIDEADVYPTHPVSHSTW
jgi:hypothetical protein